ncbi:MAG: hypothetical protein OSB00_12575 [Sphingomonas bacterium]|nr:hypothetical protein [Sphingomonas bacterium]
MPTEQPNEILAAAADAKALRESAAEVRDQSRAKRWPLRIIGVGIGSAAIAGAVLFSNSGKKKR